MMVYGVILIVKQSSNGIIISRSDVRKHGVWVPLLLVTLKLFLSYIYVIRDRKSFMICS